MFSTIINKLASATQKNKALINTVAEFQALKVEINKARCVIEFDGKGMITSVNENFIKAIGYEASELVNQHHRVLLSRVGSTHPDYQSFWKNLEDGISQTGTFTLQNKLGKPVYLMGYYAPVKHSGKPLLKVVAYLTDVTKDKTKTMSLEAEDAGINSVMGVIALSTEAEILEINEIMGKTLGYTPKEMIGRKVTDFMTVEDQSNPEFSKMWRELKNGVVLSRQVKRVAKDGKFVYFHANYFPLADASGNTYKVLAYTIPINEAIKETLEYHSQVKALGDIQAVIQFDVDGTIQSVNQNFIETMGYAETELIGQKHQIFLDSTEAAKQEYQEFWASLAKGMTKQGRFRRVAKDGKEVWLQGIYTPIADENGKIYKVVKYASDVTALVRAQENEKKAALDSARIKSMIDSASTNMMMADNDGFITYMNPSTHALMTESAAVFREVLPSFDPAKIVGSNFDIFHKSPAHQRNLLGSLTKPFETTIPVSTMFFKLKASPIFLADGARSGTALEWVNVTAERTAELEITKIVEGASSGDLSSRLNLTDKTGAVQSICGGINRLLDSMSAIIGQVREASETINTAASEIATGNNDLSARTEQQASSLEETASSMEELASTVKQNAENAKQANQLAAAASGVAVKGGEVVGNVVTTMSAINESARKIEDIISVIDGIAFQTNILALNAAVEAARAGEQGRGFAVVAGEVRNLAQRSASAAKEIKDLISDSVSKTAEGTKLVESAGATMTEIVTSVQRVTDIMGEITAASQEQSSGIDQVNSAITSMDEVTQQNAALVEEAAAAAESLVEQATTLMETVGAFKLAGGNTTRSQVRSASAVKANTLAQNRRATSSPMRGQTHQTASKPMSKPVAKTGTDDEAWEEF